VNDPLAQFRRREPKAEPPSTRTGRKPYEAYDKQGRACPYTEILCVSQASQSPQFRFFLAAVFSADYDDAFTLIYSFMAVEIKGRPCKAAGASLSGNTTKTPSCRLQKTRR
jgi:hypothetical protein